MGDLLKVLSELLREDNNYKFSWTKVGIFIILILLFLSITILTLFNPLKWENQALLKSIGEASFYVSVFFILIFGLSFGAKKYEDNQSIDMLDTIDILKELQNKFSDKKFLTPSRLTKTFRNWKDVFKVNNSNDITIVAEIEDNGDIQNFYIWTRDQEYKTKLNEIIKKENIQTINQKKMNEWGYGNNHFSFQETEEMCKNGKYNEAINFLIEILKKSEILEK